MIKLLSKLISLIAVVALIQIAVIGPIWQHRAWTGKDLTDFRDCMRRNPEVVHFCDSSNYWTDRNDQDQRAISDYLDEALGGTRAGSIDGGAFHAGIYEAFLDLMIASGQRPRAIVVPINLRSFSPEWDLKPGYAFEDRIHQIRSANSVVASALDPFLRTFQLKGDAPTSVEEFHQMPVFLGTNQVGRVLDFENPTYDDPTPERRRNKLIYYYLYRLEPEHRRLQAFKRIADKAAGAGIEVVFYITPIDMEAGEASLPGQFRAQVGANVRLILEQLAESHPPVLDFSGALPSDSFTTDDYPNEHLKEEGRRFVAGRLADELTILRVSSVRGRD